jgi:broad specificity phosphatase PhoE
VYGADQIRKGRIGLTCCISLEQGGTPKTFAGFSELDRGAWRGLMREEIGEENYENFNRARPGSSPEGGESLHDIRARVLKARDEVLSSMSPGAASAIVSHLWVTRSILSDALGQEVHVKRNSSPSPPTHPTLSALTLDLLFVRRRIWSNW